MKFVDEVTLYVKAGDGGPGCVSFYRGAGQPKGGPDGGDGGAGGHVIFRADHSVSTLLDLRYSRRILAKNGQPGMGKECNGRKAEHTIVRVPVGTIIWNVDTGEQMADLAEEGQEVQIAKGGMGGLGNMNFATSVRRAPAFAQPGTPGTEFNVRLELRLLADVGLVGFPNVGKSTLISRISAAKPKIADYPFTTLVPNLGVVRVDDGRSFVVADIPGLIPGASQGMGLGIQFLRHVSRVRVIVHLCAFDYSESRDPTADYHAIREELAAFDKTMLDTPEIIVLNKSELTESAQFVSKLQKMAEKQNRKFLAISAVAGTGIKELVSLISEVLKDPTAAFADPERALREAAELAAKLKREEEKKAAEAKLSSSSLARQRAKERQKAAKKKAAAKKKLTAKPVAQKTTAKKSVAKKSLAKKPAAKKRNATKPVSKKAGTKKALTTRSAAKKTTPKKKNSGKQVAGKKSLVKKQAAKPAKKKSRR